MSSAPEIVAAMREAGGAEVRLTGAWLDLAQQNETLREALKLAFGRGFPTVQRLGLWLNEHIGTKTGELTLLGSHSAHAKAWRYAVWTEHETATQAERVAAEKARREAERQAEREHWAAKELKRQEAMLTPAQRRARDFELVIPIQRDPLHSPPAEPKPEYLAHTRVGLTGQFTRENILGRDGMPVRAIPEKPPARVAVSGLTPAAKPLPPPPGETRHSMSPQAIAHRAMQAAAGTPMLDGSDPACRFPGIGLTPSDNQRWSQKL